MAGASSFTLSSGTRGFAREGKCFSQKGQDDWRHLQEPEQEMRQRRGAEDFAISNLLPLS